MRETPRYWLLERERDALPRLDSIRRAAVAPEKATFLEAVAEIFRPRLGVWVSLAVLWLALLTAHLRISAEATTFSKTAGQQPDMALIAIPNDEKISLLDAHS
jgi:hypothetical protein